MLSSGVKAVITFTSNRERLAAPAGATLRCCIRLHANFSHAIASTSIMLIGTDMSRAVSCGI
jgi:hypothetical protein